MSADEAWGLVELARSRGVRLGCSPFTLLGEAQQTAWKTIRDERVGEVRAVFCEVDWGRIEGWHPAPQPFYEVGPVSDVGITRCRSRPPCSGRYGGSRRSDGCWRRTA